RKISQIWRPVHRTKMIFFVYIQWLSEGYPVERTIDNAPSSRDFFGASRDFLQTQIYFWRRSCRDLNAWPSRAELFSIAPLSGTAARLAKGRPHSPGNPKAHNRASSDGVSAPPH